MPNYNSKSGIITGMYIISQGSRGGGNFQFPWQPFPPPSCMLQAKLSLPQPFSSSLWLDNPPPPSLAIPTQKILQPGRTIPDYFQDLCKTKDLLQEAWIIHSGEKKPALGFTHLSTLEIWVATWSKVQKM